MAFSLYRRSIVATENICRRIPQVRGYFLSVFGFLNLDYLMKDRMACSI